MGLFQYDTIELTLDKSLMAEGLGSPGIQYMIINWERSDGTEKLLIKSDERRPYLYPAPVLRQDMTTLLGYDCSNELAVSVSLSVRPNRTLCYVEALAKQSLWFVKHLCEQTDMIEQHVPIRYCVTHDVREMLTPYLRACNFPDDKIDWIDSKEQQYPQSTKFRALKHESFQDVERLLHLDSTLFIDTGSSQRNGTWFKNVKDMWQTEPYAQAHSYEIPDEPKYQKFRDYRVMTIFNDWWGKHLSPDVHILWSTLADYLNGDAADIKHHFLKDAGVVTTITGVFFGFSRDGLDALDLEGDIYPVMRVSGDEAALAAYACREGWVDSSVCDLEQAFNWDDLPVFFEPDTEHHITWSDQRIPTELWRRQYE